MTIKKRLAISNILMILVPVVITAAIATACIAVIWFTTVKGPGLGMEHSEDFDTASRSISVLTETFLADSSPTERAGEISDLGRLINKNSLDLSVYSSGIQLYHFGNLQGTDDEKLLAAMSALDGEGTVSSGNRQCYGHQANIKGIVYSIYVFGAKTETSYETLMVVIALCGIFLAFGILLSILFTNRFLIKFVFHKIEHPLDILADGVRQIRDGNLQYRIEYDNNDEFKPICADFNEMAVRLKESVDLSNRHEQSRKELLAGISHDLRSPLTSIRAYVEGLLDGVAKTPVAQRAYLETIKAKAEDIDRMVEKIFLFSKLELGEAGEHPETLNLTKELEDFVHAVEMEYREKGLLISAESLDPATITADPESLRRVLTNITENSLKYKDKALGHLKIFLNSQKSSAVLTLEDDGPGVPDEALPQLFDVFYRSDPARKDPQNGSGLGLAIAAKAIAQMNGSISAVNVEGGGLAIVIVLPIQEVKS